MILQQKAINFNVLHHPDGL